MAKKSSGLESDRTHLANERTLLAYFRTSLAMFGMAALIIKFLPPEYFVLGTLTAVFGFGLLVYGSRKYDRTKRKINGD